MPRRFILASSSPRRKEILSLLRLPFEVHPSQVDESQIGPNDPDDIIEHALERLAERLAYEKARDVFDQIRFGQILGEERNIVLSADTIVVTTGPGESTILGKPHDEVSARHMLGLLSGAIHTVHTGLCLMECDWQVADEEWISFWNTSVVATEVVFRELSAEMIDSYVATGEAFDKAGAYGIQGYASAFVKSIRGDYFNVVGLPIATVAEMLENIGIEWWRGAEALE